MADAPVDNRSLEEIWEDGRQALLRLKAAAEATGTERELSDCLDHALDLPHG